MTDRYANIRKALEMGPTPGPWEASYDKGSTRDIITQKEKFPVCMVRGVAYVGQSQYLANGHFIAACDPDTIRELLAERDALRDFIEAKMHHLPIEDQHVASILVAALKHVESSPLPATLEVEAS